MTGEDDEGKSDFNKIFWRTCVSLQNMVCDITLKLAIKVLVYCSEKKSQTTFSLLVHGGKYFMDSFLKTNMSVANLDLA